MTPLAASAAIRKILVDLAKENKGGISNLDMNTEAGEAAKPLIAFTTDFDDTIEGGKLLMQGSPKIFLQAVSLMIAHIAKATEVSTRTIMMMVDKDLRSTESDKSTQENFADFLSEMLADMKKQTKTSDKRRNPFEN